MNNNKIFPLKVGLFGIGLEAYWEQFEGLEKRLQNYISIAEEKMKSYQCEVVNLGLIDNPEKAIIAGHDFRKADVDIIFLYVTTYALSSTVLSVVQRAKVPVIILNLSPEAAIDYAAFNTMTDRYFSSCASCCSLHRHHTLRPACCLFLLPMAYQ